jgi:hypothetical protein
MPPADAHYDSVGLVCRADASARNTCLMPNDDFYTLPLPASNDQAALDFLAGIGGSSTGTGQALQRVGIDAPVVRAQYKQAIEDLARQIAERLERGQSKEQVARWAVEQRRQIVSRMRSGSGPMGRTLYEIRDWRKYGPGGRTYANMVRHYQTRGVPSAQIPDRLIAGATRSNAGVNQAALRGASYLRHGGRVLIVVGVAISAARIWNASEAELPKVIGEELGGFIGGSLGASAAVGACLVFGVATGGWGLLACGIVGGAAGGLGGSMIGGAITDGIYYSDDATPADQLGNVIIEIPASRVYSSPPSLMCMPR